MHDNLEIFPTTIGLVDVERALRFTTDRRARHYLQYAATEYVWATHTYSDTRGTAGCSLLHYRAPRRVWDQGQADHYAGMITRWYRRAVAAGPFA